MQKIGRRDHFDIVKLRSWPWKVDTCKNIKRPVRVGGNVCISSNRGVMHQIWHKVILTYCSQYRLPCSPLLPRLPGGTWGAQSVRRLPSARVEISGSWMAPHSGLCPSPCLCECALAHSLSLINKVLKKQNKTGTLCPTTPSFLCLQSSSCMFSASPYSNLNPEFYKGRGFCLLSSLLYCNSGKLCHVAVVGVRWC